MGLPVSLAKVRGWTRPNMRFVEIKTCEKQGAWAVPERKRRKVY